MESSMDLADHATGIAALAEPVRRELYEYVVAQQDAVGREEAAAGVGIAVHTAKFHLERLVQDGLLDVEFRRLSGRTGPGAGRPAKLYRRSGLEWSVSLPPRRYDLVGHILASGVERAAAEGLDVDTALDHSALAEGRRVGGAAAAPAEPGDQEGGDWARLAGTLADQGYEPRVEDDEVLLANCPFDALAREHTALVCRLNRSFVQGVADGLGFEDVEVRLEPEPGLCCVKTTRRGRAHPSGSP
jgi:predicted ArsR family transcriptional regulator